MFRTSSCPCAVLWTLYLWSEMSSASPAQDKLLVPDDDAQKQAATLIANLYKSEYDEAKTPEQQSELAKKMLQVGIDSKNDPTGRYVLFRIAKDIAAGAGDAATALSAIEQTEALYEVDALTMKADVLAKVVKTLKLPKDHQDLAATHQAAFDDAISQDRFALAKTINAVALDSARQARSPDLVKQVVAQGKEIEEIKAEYKQVQAAFHTLTTAPTDPEANLLVGRYQCFVKGDWDGGLLMLALGSDEELKKLAGAELAEKPDALALGNAWWDYSESVEGKLHVGARQRAAAWYKDALPRLDGLSKKLVESRMQTTPEHWSTPKGPPIIAAQEPKVRKKSPAIIAHVWEVRASAGQHFKAALRTDGTFRSGTWSRSGDKVVVRWKQGWVDRLTISADGRTMVGINQHGNRTTWKLTGVETSNE